MLPHLDLAVQLPNVLVIEGEEAAEEGVQKHAHRPDVRLTTADKNYEKTLPNLYFFTIHLPR